MRIPTKSKKNKGYTILDKIKEVSYSKSDYVKLGDRLRVYKTDDIDIPIEDLEMLQSLRTSYKTPLSKIFEILQDSILQVNKNAIITYRIKRIDSIISKLIRLEKTQLPRIEDIAGCRCILSYYLVMKKYISSKKYWGINYILNQIEMII